MLASLVGKIEHKPLKQWPGYLQCPWSYTAREGEQLARRAWPAQHQLIPAFFPTWQSLRKNADRAVVIPQIWNATLLL